ncbi:winged helix-turn-helix transcriptional regulator [Shewanella baltica]|uniref:winged helix-turn-helix transcriptional regulator n=1 Tax=Shewanella baltica TaxID=62322 RepID=UPI000DFC6624|nr:winged helix-turn-helix transcriptional regulator [Shewanella baltica]SUI68247.1 Uncharacterised protein [Shewanella baltica]
MTATMLIAVPKMHTPFQPALSYTADSANSTAYRIEQHIACDQSAMLASDGTAYQEYVLTEMGRGLFPVIIALRQWGEDHLYQPDEQHSVLIDTQTGEPVTRLELRSKEHQVLE